MAAGQQAGIFWGGQQAGVFWGMCNPCLHLLLTLAENLPAFQQLFWKLGVFISHRQLNCLPFHEKSSGMQWKRPRPLATQMREFCAKVPIWLCETEGQAQVCLCSLFGKQVGGEQAKGLYNPSAFSSPEHHPERRSPASAVRVSGTTPGCDWQIPVTLMLPIHQTSSKGNWLGPCTLKFWMNILLWKWL